MAGGLMTMPMLIINMGGEMVYILQQRLQAQNIPANKSKKVLVDVVKTMYSPRFIGELFKLQRMYTNKATRQVFDRLAHSSIMRLNESSMDKLYDLMSMGFKYQIVSITSAEQLVQVTLNHLQSLKKIVDSDVVSPLIEETIVQIMTMYGNLSAGDFYLLKQELCRFFQGRRVKVSLFLQDGIQNLDGTIVIPLGGPVAAGGEIPGRIKFYDANGRLNHDEDFNIQQEINNTSYDRTPLLERSLNTCPYGENLYSKDRTSIKSSPAEMEAAAKKAGVKTASLKKASKCSLKATARDEMNLLADLLGSAAKDSEESKPFKINLFGNDSMDDSKDGEAMVRTITIDGTSDRKSLKTRMDELNFDDKTKGGEDKKSSGDDLLDLMDSA